MLSVHERIQRLLDPHSFEPFEPDLSGFFICGRGRVDGREVYVSASNTGTPACAPWAGIRQEVRFLESILADPLPTVFLVDAQKPVTATAGKTPVPPDAAELHAGKECVGRTYYLQALLQKRVPLVGGLFGKVAAALSFPLALCDAVVMVEGAALCTGRPDAVKLMLGQEVTFEELAGARMHCTVSGTGHALVSSDEDALDWIRRYLSFFPQRAGDQPPCAVAVEPSASAASLGELIPSDCLRPFEVHGLIDGIIDEGSLLEVKTLKAPEVVTGLVRIEGRVAGIVANNPRVQGGILFPDTCRKMSQFIETCGSFDIPLVFLVDTPGFMVGRESEEAGIVKAGADLFASITHCRSPRLCIVVRKAYTAGLYAMAASGFSPARLLALPTASISVYGRKALERFAAAGGLTEEGSRMLEQMLRNVENPYEFLDKGLLDGVIGLEDIRGEIASFLVGCDHTRRDRPFGGRQ
ncbi:MAG: carboxyl transferase domain-containing protein [Acidobacteriota bacterium]